MKRIFYSSLAVLFLHTSIANAGPAAASICGVVCAAIGAGGCTAGSLLLAWNPPAAALYASVCGAIQATGGTAGCIAACIALPTP